MTIGIVASVVGEAYYKFVFPWSVRIAGLNRRPDVVTIAHDGIPEIYRSAVDEILTVQWIKSDMPWKIHPQINVNAAIAETDTTWIAKVDIDDLLFCHALDGVDSSLCDVMNYGYRIGDQDYPSIVYPAEYIKQKVHNPIGSCSPFRRWLWEENPFEDMLYDDWCFWIKAARLGADFDATHRVDYIYSVHPEQMTNRIDHAQALAEIQAL